jgi:hypothetical protein
MSSAVSVPPISTGGEMNTSDERGLKLNEVRVDDGIAATHREAR